MNTLIKIGATALILGTTYGFALTADETKAHALAGAEHCKTVGVAACVEDFGKKGGKWDKGNLYIWANDMQGIMTAHPKKRLAGKNMYTFKDKKGTQFIKEFIDIVNAKGSGWVDYVWAHPKTRKQTKKSSFVIGIGENQMIGAGYYHKR